MIDVRTPEEVLKNFFPGAKNIPVDKLSLNMVKDLLSDRQLDSSEVYLLCQSGIRAEIAANKLSELDDIQVTIIQGGMNGINSLLSPDSQSKNSMSIERQVRITVGILVTLSVVSGVLFNPLYLGLAVFIGLGLIFAGISNNCMMGLLLMKAPWNR